MTFHPVMVPLWGGGATIPQTCKDCAAYMHAIKAAGMDTIKAAPIGARRQMFGGFGDGLTAALALLMCGRILAPQLLTK